MRDAFSDCHPLVQLLFFAAVLGFTMSLTHPVCLLFSFLAALSYYFLLAGGQGIRRLLLFAVPAALLAALLNALFNHSGTQILFLLPWGNPVTLESLLYGIYAAFMLLSTILWFACFSRVMTSDRLIFLFGRVLPAFSLLISLVLRFIPYYVRRFREVREAGRMLGVEDGKGVRAKWRELKRSFEVMTELTLEGAVISADSMRARGYGLAKRSSMKPYRMTSRDRAMLIFLIFEILFILLFFRYFPSLRGVFFEPLTLFSAFCLMLLYTVPHVLRVKEASVWHSFA